MQDVGTVLFTVRITVKVEHRTSPEGEADGESVTLPAKLKRLLMVRLSVLPACPTLKLTLDALSWKSPACIVIVA